MGETLCWRCRNAVPSLKTGAGCPWSMRLEPVPGWTAEPSSWSGGIGRARILGFRVIACPQFETEGPKKESKVIEMSRARTWDVEKAKELLSLGTMSYEEIAERVGVSMSTLNKYIKTLSQKNCSGLTTENGWAAVPPAPAESSAPDIKKPPVPEQTPMGVAALAEILTAVAENFDGAEVTVSRADGTKIVGCEANVEYGSDGRPRKVVLKLL